MDIVTNPIQFIISHNRGMSRINQNNLEPFLGAVLSDGIRIKNSEIRVLPTGSFFGDALSVFLSRDTTHALSLRPSTRSMPLFPSGSLRNTNASDDDSLFRLISKVSGFIESRWAFNAGYGAFVAPRLFAFPL
jgi:hypothetical protein